MKYFLYNVVVGKGVVMVKGVIKYDDQHRLPVDQAPRGA